MLNEAYLEHILNLLLNFIFESRSKPIRFYVDLSCPRDERNGVTTTSRWRIFNCRSKYIRVSQQQLLNLRSH
jgi:hypothetical protein